MNKRKISLIFALILYLTSFANVYAIGGYEAGIYKKTNNDSKTYEYEEVTFVTGKPVLLKGTLTRTKIDKEKEDNTLKKEIDKAKRKNSIKTKSKKKKNNTFEKQNLANMEDIPLVSYTGSKVSEKYSLTGDGVSITRDLTITPYVDYYNGQMVKKNQISKIKESISLDGEVFNLDSNLSEMSESEVIDKKPSIDYIAGNSNFHKVFKSDQNEMIIEMDGRSFGYDEFWGETETKVLNYEITTNPLQKKQNGKEDNNKEETTPSKALTNGEYTVKLSQNTKKDLIYSENDPRKISFSGGYIVTTKNTGALEYNYDINDIKGNGSFEKENNPDIQRLFAPVYIDIKGHYAEDAIKVIASMNGFDISKKKFLPNSPISREEFARAVVVTAGIYDNKTDKTKNNYFLKEELFSDVSRNDFYYKYIKKAVDKHLMIGTGDNKFSPKDTITKGEAIKILTDSLGLEDLIPNGNYSNSYLDSNNIPGWVYNNVYIAKKIGLVDESDTFNANEQLTKADACEMLLKYIEYMTDDLKEDFMHKILNY